MRKLILIIAIFFSMVLELMPVSKAEVMPYYSNRIDKSSIGLYQATNSFTVYEKPDIKSKVLVEGSFDYKNYNCAVAQNEMFLVFIQLKELAFFQVIDEEEEWYQIAYGARAKGWIKKEDASRFLNWRAFYNLYGKKYGLYYFKDAPVCTKSLHSATDVSSQTIGRINIAKIVKLTAIKGNWALVSILDLDKITKIGYVQWRSLEGIIYLFPAIK